MDLTGIWIGRHVPDCGGPVAAFDVELMCRDEMLSGLLCETDIAAGEVRARVEGAFKGGRVTFRRCFIDHDPGDDAIFSGWLDEAGDRIVGRWWYPLTGRAHGRFSMARMPMSPIRTGQVDAAPAYSRRD